MSTLKVGTLASGKTWALVECHKPSLLPADGIHVILFVPRDAQDIAGDAFREDELTVEEYGEIANLANSFGKKYSAELGDPGHYRLMMNGETAGAQEHLHFHIVVGTKGFKFRRCVDPIGADIV